MKFHFPPVTVVSWTNLWVAEALDHLWGGFLSTPVTLHFWKPVCFKYDLIFSAEFLLSHWQEGRRACSGRSDVCILSTWSVLGQCSCLFQALVCWECWGWERGRGEERESHLSSHWSLSVSCWLI